MSPASRARPQGAGAIVSPLIWAIAGICASGGRQHAVRTRTLAQTTLAASADTGLRVLASSALRVATGPRLMASFQIFETHAHIHVALGSTAIRHAHTHRRLRLCRCRGQDCDEGKSHDHTHCAQHFMNLRRQRDQGSLRERRAACKREIRAPALRRAALDSPRGQANGAAQMPFQGSTWAMRTPPASPGQPIACSIFAPSTARTRATKARQVLPSR
jgi:hypothetical protein